MGFALNYSIKYQKCHTASSNALVNFERAVRQKVSGQLKHGSLLRRPATGTKEAGDGPGGEGHLVPQGGQHDKHSEKYNILVCDAQTRGERQSGDHPATTDRRQDREQHQKGQGGEEAVAAAD